MKEIIYKMFFASKKGVTMAFAIAAALIEPVKPVLLTVFFITLLDLYTGIKASSVQKQKELGKEYKFKFSDITSGGLFKTLSKCLDYLLFVIAGHFAATHIIQEMPFVKIIAGAIIGIEFWSIGENIHKIHGVNIIDYIKRYFIRKDIVDVIDPESNNKKPAENADTKV